MATNPQSHRVIAGAMTGTSIDGIDACILDVQGEGLHARATLKGTASGSLGPCSEMLRSLASEVSHSAAEITATRRRLSKRILQTIQKAAGASRVDLAVVHGQTITHAPPDSWQLIDTATIAAGLDCPVAGDVRAGDLACGGQGAPITPLGDWMLFRSDHPTAVVNLGGFCNITWLPETSRIEDIRGADVCACNHLLDSAAVQRLGQAFDDGGGIAATGSPQSPLVDSLMEILRQSAASNRSLGTGDESVDWLSSRIPAETPTPDLLASIADAIGKVIGSAVRAEGCEEVLLAGGGSRHQPLARSIAAAAGIPTCMSDTRGIPVEMREAACLALLGLLDRDGVPFTLPQVTGRASEHFVGMSWCQPTPTPRKVEGT
ncbi:MAG: hypothetical protein GY876_07905 [Planctomycetes bacterium]|nr:hypothetical protein [Planctomycetota bacterium]